jgi:hypothetical protein
MGPIVVVAIILGIIVVLFVLDWRLNRTRTRPWRKAPSSETRADREHRPHQSSNIGPFRAAAPAETAALPAEPRHELGAEGRLAEHWPCRDDLGQFARLGLTPPPEVGG